MIAILYTTTAVQRFPNINLARGKKMNTPRLAVVVTSFFNYVVGRKTATGAGWLAVKQSERFFPELYTSVHTSRKGRVVSGHTTKKASNK